MLELHPRGPATTPFAVDRVPFPLHGQYTMGLMGHIDNACFTFVLCERPDLILMGQELKHFTSESLAFGLLLPHSNCQFMTLDLILSSANQTPDGLASLLWVRFIVHPPFGIQHFGFGCI